ncbi:MAG: TIGR00296 family protein [Candidatus Gagatemarchaeaceae archaeon]
MPLSIQEGRTAVQLARGAVEAHLTRGRPPAGDWPPGLFSELRGVFVTLNVAGGGRDRLRGCIGFPFPVKRLGDAIQEAALAAATEDPRFPPVSLDELDSIEVEVSVLTPPEDAEGPRQSLPSRVRIGEDGLIVSRGYLSGLLLPQVAPEFGMDQTEFLSQTCLKAGLPSDAWLNDSTNVQIFQAEVFAETGPRGKVVRVKHGELPRA